MTKRIITAILAALLALSACVCLPACSAPAEEGESDTQNTSATTLYVYNWGEYISDGSYDSLDVNQAFEEWCLEEKGVEVKVNYSTFSSNEEMYAKISSGAVSYDVIVPSDYMIERLIDEKLLHPLNKDHFEYLDNLHPDFYGPDATYDYYDKGSVYSVPYFYGMIGIIYNTSMVDEADVDGTWELMWNEKYAGNILQFNNSRDAFGSAQYALGLDINSDNEQDWRAALEKLKEQKPILQGYVMDEIYNKMENGSAAIAAYYAGDYLTMYENMCTAQCLSLCGEECQGNCEDESLESLEFFYPKAPEGSTNGDTNLYVDAMCIPKSSKNKEVAEWYIDFMLMEEPAVANALYTYYASPNAAVRNSEEYIKGMADIKEDAYEKMYDDSVKATYYENLSPEKLALINQLWEELKSDAQISAPLFIICGVIVAVIAGFAIFFAIRRKKRAIY